MINTINTITVCVNNHCYIFFLFFFLNLKKKTTIVTSYGITVVTQPPQCH